MRERLGQSGRTLTEWGRVERALRDRPRLEAALVSGTLPWSKVRLFTRFELGGREEDRREAGIAKLGGAADEAEAVWIAQAGGMSVRALERAVRVVDRGAADVAAAVETAEADETDETDEEGISTEEREWVRVRGSARMAFAWSDACRMSSKVAGQRIPPAARLRDRTAAAPRGRRPARSAASPQSDGQR